MTETISKIEKWSYPLKAAADEAADPQQFYRALAKARDGYYPLGANGLWHGGVHFDEDTGLVNDATEVRCIADGEVVAYRIDEVYPTSEFGSMRALYSTGFVLVKHRLEVPADPGAQPAPGLTIFSLYMHLLDWNTYSVRPTLARPGFWSGGTRQVKTSVKGKVLGLRVRQAPKGQTGYGTVLTVLPRGTTVETGEADRGWLKVLSVTPAQDSLPPDTGWVFKAEMTATTTPNRYVIGTAAKDEMIPPQKGLEVRAQASQSSATKAMLPIGTQVKIGNDGTPGKYQKLLEIVSGNAVPPLALTDGILGYVWEGSLKTISEPATKNAVHVLNQPFPLKAGSLIGHVGKYQNHSDPAPRNLLHLEVFSCEDVEAFAQLSKSKVMNLPATEKTLVKIPKDSLLITHVEGMSAANPPKVTDAHKTVGHDFMIPVAALEALPAEKKIKVPVVMGGSTTYTFWWRVDGLLGDAEGNEISGWFAEPDIALSRHSPFEWEGFTFIKETATNIDHLADFLHSQESLSEEEKLAHLPNVGHAAEGSIKQRLHKLLDKNSDKTLTSSEIKEALAKPWCSQQISRMVTCYESEWLHDNARWDALDELMGHEESDPHQDWIEEKSRITSLSWWLELKQKYGIGDGGSTQHIHPIGLIASFTGSRELITLEMLKAANPGGAEGHHRNILPYLNKYALVYKLEQPRAIAHFLSQVGHESGFRVIEENLRYSARQMKKTYGCRRQNNVNGYNEQTDSCDFGTLRIKLWTEENHYAMNAENLGSYVYADRMGNGDEASREGYMYRGRGMLQVTGKSEYLRFTNVHNQKNPTDIQDFIANPDLLVSSIDYGVESAFVFWFSKTGQGGAKLFEVAKSGSVADVTQMVNGGQNGYLDRNSRFQSVCALMNF